jgi:hypothetical protein
MRSRRPKTVARPSLKTSPPVRAEHDPASRRPLPGTRLNDEAIAETNTDLCSLSGSGNALREMRQPDAVGSVRA